MIDYPPSLGILTIISLVAATHVLVPIQTQFKAFQGTDLLLNTIARLRKSSYVPMQEQLKKMFLYQKGARRLAQKGAPYLVLTDGPYGPELAKTEELNHSILERIGKALKKASNSIKVERPEETVKVLAPQKRGFLNEYIEERDIGLPRSEEDLIKIFSSYSIDLKNVLKLARYINIKPAGGNTVYLILEYDIKRSV